MTKEQINLHDFTVVPLMPTRVERPFYAGFTVVSNWHLHLLIKANAACLTPILPFFLRCCLLSMSVAYIQTLSKHYET